MNFVPLFLRLESFRSICKATGVTDIFTDFAFIIIFNINVPDIINQRLND